MKPKMGGRLIAFEGPDGVGKTTLSQRTVEWLGSQGCKTRYLSFPGRDPGSLGKLVYDIHHNSNKFGVSHVEPTALQLLHVAAHIDALHSSIRPALKDGENIVMDRYWWSTIVYGKIMGVAENSLRVMIDLEKLHWVGLRPSVLFLLQRATQARAEQPSAVYEKLQSAYAELAKNEAASCEIRKISTNGTSDESFAEIIAVLQQINGQKQLAPARQEILPLSVDRIRSAPAPVVFAKISPAVPSKVYDTYWQFAAKRQDIFFQRFRNMPPPWTGDLILSHFKFTNAYRASDRVSQYLIKHVIYQGSQEPEELLFRILLFKLFNKIETWKLLERELGPMISTRFDLEAFDKVLTRAMSEKQKIYSAAYIMPSGGKHGDAKKHRNHLKLLKTMLADGVAQSLQQMKRMREAFELLLSYPMIGGFLAYQYVTDLNYSSLTDFSEMEFVVPGPGARDGIRKCFKDFGGLNEADIIRMVADRQDREFERLNLDFKSLWGRPLQLIDCQNLFCEVDKYARHAHPEIIGITGRTRIKQMFRSTQAQIEYWYPPKWHLNEAIAREQEAVHARI